jgi:hypothetical protein
MFHTLRPWAWIVAAVFAVLTRVWTQVMASDLPDGSMPFEYPPYGLWAPGVLWCSFVNSALMLSTLLPRSKLELLHCIPPLRTCVGWVISSMVICLGLTPYLGIRTYPALAMFSNLRTEGGLSNHAFIRDDLDFLGWQRDYVTVHETNIPALRLAQVDLAPLFTPSTIAVLKNAGLDGEFWITPPVEAWPYPETRPFKPYSMPFLELRRRIAPLHSKKNSTGYVRYTRTIATPQLRLPWLRSAVGIHIPTSDAVWHNISYDLSKGGDGELEILIPWWQASLARFRTFDAQYSPCRH